MTIHVGEEGGEHGVQEIGEVVESLRPDRLGHGILAARDPALMEAIRAADITLEICPTSNLLTKALRDEDEVRETFRTFVEHGVPFTIATDGPEMMRTHLRDELELLRADRRARRERAPARERARPRRLVRRPARARGRLRRRAPARPESFPRAALRSERYRPASMELGLRGRTAIICGASSGLGLASAEALAAEGANVAMFARRRDILERDADRIGALAVRGDVTNAADLERLVERTVEAFGGIDILVWNSGGPPAGAGLGDHRPPARVGVRAPAAARGAARAARAARTSERARPAVSSSSPRSPSRNRRRTWRCRTRSARASPAGRRRSRGSSGRRRSPSTASRPAASTRRA